MGGTEDERGHCSRIRANCRLNFAVHGRAVTAGASMNGDRRNAFDDVEDQTVETDPEGSSLESIVRLQSGRPSERRANTHPRRLCPFHRIPIAPVKVSRPASLRRAQPCAPVAHPFLTHEKSQRGSRGTTRLRALAASRRCTRRLTRSEAWTLLGARSSPTITT